MKKLSILEVELKGFPRIRYHEEEIEFRTTKSLALFIYLCVESLLYPKQKIAREKLTDLLWPGMPISSALQNLRQCIYQTRKSLPPHKDAQGEPLEWILSDRKTLMLNAEAPVEVDIAPFLQASLLSKTPLLVLQIPLVPILENFYVPESDAFDAWVEELRQRVKKEVIKHGKGQIEVFRNQKQWHKILPYAELLIRLEPLHEPYYQYLIEAQVENQQILEAQKTLQGLENILQEELGYAASAETRALLPQTPTHPPRKEPVRDIPKPSSRLVSRLSGIGGLTLLIALLFIAWQFWPNQSLPLENSEPYSIAVLSFEQGNVEEYQVNGLSEAIIEQLSKVKGLKVISPRSSMRYPQKLLDPQKIGQDLGVGYLLMGEVSENRGQLLARVRLVQVSTGKVTWSSNFEHPSRDIFQFPQEIAQQATEQLGVSSLNLRFPTKEVYTPNSEAYDWYLKGREAFYHVYSDSLRQAIKCFRKALTIDPDFTLARVHLAWTHCTLAGTWGDAQVEDVFIETKLHLDAIQQNAAYRDMYHIINAFLNLWTLDKLQAAREFQKAVSVNPNIDFGYGGLSLMNTLLGKYEEAKQLAYKSLEFNPHFFWNKFCLADAHFFAGEFTESERLARETIAVNPNHLTSIAILSRSLAAQGKYEEAIQILSPFEEKDPYTKGQLGVVYFHAGQKEKAQKIRQEMENRHAQGEKRQAYYIAMLYNLSGQTQKALDWLEKSLATLESQLNWLEVDHEFRNLHDSPRFQKLRQEMPLAFGKK